MSDPSGATAEAPERYPDGENPQMVELATQLRRLLDKDGLAHLAFYYGDTAKVVLDAEVPGGRDEQGVPLISHSHEQAGRHLYYILEELEPDFADLRTGALIRTVLRVPEGAIFYYLVEPGYHLYGATSAVNRLDELDARMADSVNHLRTDVNYHPLDFGSYLSKKSAIHARSAPEPPPSGSPASDRAPHDDSPDTGHTTTEILDPGGAPDATTALLRDSLDVDGLHYVTYYSGGIPVCSADIFHHEALRKYFRGPTPQQRRDKYSRMGQLLPGVTRRMNMSLRAILQGEVLQIVLDVEQGAVYYHSLPDRRCLMGVTLDQTRVAEADRRVGQLGRELAGG